MSLAPCLLTGVKLDLRSWQRCLPAWLPVGLLGQGWLIGARCPGAASTVSQG
ncbi:MAG: hypothetical protein KGQ93_08225 [Cyanobacteria bacterium REEB459]|nr:hypothetical protein [Cyanobacteria bacterium REEB459]